MEDLYSECEVTPCEDGTADEMAEMESHIKSVSSFYDLVWGWLEKRKRGVCLCTGYDDDDGCMFVAVTFRKDVESKQKEIGEFYIPRDLIMSSFRHVQPVTKSMPAEYLEKEIYQILLGYRNPKTSWGFGENAYCILNNRE